MVSVEEAKLDGLYVAESNPMLVEGSRPINVPYRWVSAVHDVVLLKYFPKRVSLKKKGAPANEEDSDA